MLLVINVLKGRHTYKNQCVNKAILKNQAPAIDLKTANWPASCLLVKARWTMYIPSKEFWMSGKLKKEASTK